MNINIQYVIDAAKQDMGRNWAFGSGFEALKEHCQKLITLLEEACVELEEDDGARTRMRNILVRTANALKGDPGPVRMHSWHDLPKIAARFATPPTKACEEVDQGRTAPASDMTEIAKRINAEARAVLSLDEQGRKDAQDARRYRWLRNVSSIGDFAWMDFSALDTIESVEQKIDVAIASAGEARGQK